MSDYDPEEMVKFDNKDVSLWTAVHNIMSRPAVKRTGTAAFRAEGKKSSILDAAGHREDRSASGLQRTAAAP
jgi:hypothetical protein